MAAGAGEWGGCGNKARREETAQLRKEAAGRGDKRLSAAAPFSGSGYIILDEAPEK